MTELDALLILNAIPGLSNTRKKQLITYYGSALKILSLKKIDLVENNKLRESSINNILHFSKDKFLKDEYNLIAAQRVSVLGEQDDRYPALLKEIDDSPIILYIKGDIPQNMNMSIAIVGSRSASIEGRLIAEKFAYQFSEMGITIVSGLARGIDTAAHRGALRAKGKTVAILGSGLSCIYPKENKKLSEEISLSSAVISEYPMKTTPLPYNFPRRNRIISGLSLGVIVIEAALKSGALITADFALEQGREVFAVPGSIQKPTCEGVNNLIKQGAKMVTCFEDVLEEISEKLKSFLQKDKSSRVVEQEDSMRRNVPPQIMSDLEKNESLLYNAVHKQPRHIDELAGQCGFSSALTSSVLLQLELKHKIKQLPGKIFIKL